MKVIILYGPPASGKLTVAEKLSSKTKFNSKVSFFQEQSANKIIDYIKRN